MDIVLFEGWMSGFSALPDGKARRGHDDWYQNILECINCWKVAERASRDSSPLRPVLVQVESVSPDLVEVNRLLRSYRSAWDSLVDCWLVIRIGDPQVRGGYIVFLNRRLSDQYSHSANAAFIQHDCQSPLMCLISCALCSAVGLQVAPSGGGENAGFGEGWYD